MIKQIMSGVLCAALWVSGAALADEETGNNVADSVYGLPVSEVPESVMATVKNKQAGVYITNVNREQWSNDEVYYRIEGSQVGRFYVFLVRADGYLRSFDEENEAPAGND